MLRSHLFVTRYSREAILLLVELSAFLARCCCCCCCCCRECHRATNNQQVRCTRMTISTGSSRDGAIPCQAFAAMRRMALLYIDLFISDLARDQREPKQSSAREKALKRNPEPICRWYLQAVRNFSTNAISEIVKRDIQWK